jgi:hypothetical protein
MKKLLLLALICTANISASSQIYIDSADLDIREDTFFIHTGENFWVETHSVYTDDNGLYYIQDKKSKQMVKKWKCPYCHHMWPVGQRCQNAQCPSKY